MKLAEISVCRRSNLDEVKVCAAFDAMAGFYRLVLLHAIRYVRFIS